ncbi:hypothetical protein J5N97_028667 [Dioscorea zingiberensis]|uniref:Inhibitor I9 domain-containing protein n=1 Tax=Dioscorea zingiberensis TaxID=325984 RepID=A0A9D5BZB8_9LILI|nr:hypothetical protein J5N97_028667 [Dioscorea zingiberensis]
MSSLRPLIFLALLMLVQAQHVPIDDFAAEESSEEHFTYIVLTDNKAMPPQYKSVDQWYWSLLNSLPAQRPELKPKLLYVYPLLHGFAAFLTPQQAELLSKSPGLINIYIDKSTKIEEFGEAKDAEAKDVNKEVVDGGVKREGERDDEGKRSGDNLISEIDLQRSDEGLEEAGMKKRK